MKRFECSMQKRKESFCSKKNEMKAEATKVGRFTIYPKDTSKKQAGIEAYQQRLHEMGFKLNLHNNGDYIHDCVLEIGKIPGATIYVGTINHFQKPTQEYQYEAELYMENDKGIRSNIEYMPFVITDISDGMQRKMYFNRLNSLIKKGNEFVRNHESSESKKSEAENPKDVIGDELPYGMMQYRDEDTKEWLPVIVSVNNNDRGWYYYGLAPTDNLGGFGYEEYSREFLKTCKSGTDKCDPKLVQAMKKFYIDSATEDGLKPIEVNNLVMYIPKGKPYIGKD